jgi:hypothetical protein
MSQENLKKYVIQAVNNQLKLNDPVETALTYERLLQSGYSTQHAKTMIADCLLEELKTTLKHKRIFDKASYVDSLNKLPKPSPIIKEE